MSYAGDELDGIADVDSANSAGRCPRVAATDDDEITLDSRTAGTIFDLER